MDLATQRAELVVHLCNRQALEPKAHRLGYTAASCSLRPFQQFARHIERDLAYVTHMATNTISTYGMAIFPTHASFPRVFGADAMTEQPRILGRRSGSDEPARP